MRRLRVGRLSAVISLAVAAICAAQSFNVAIGPPTAQPDAGYAAAGIPGYWNALPANHGSFTHNIRDVNNVVTGVRLYQYGGTQLLEAEGGPEGDDGVLLNHYLITYTPALETCVFLNFLQPGEYEAIIYGWMPGNPDAFAYTNCDEEPGNPHKYVGGAWPGEHQDGVTYSTHYANVGGNGLLRMHSGIVPGGEPATGAACNGVQVRKLPPRLPADMNCDGLKNGRDIQAFVRAMTSLSAYRAAHPMCNILNGDMNGDWAVSPADVGAFVAALMQ